MKLENQVVSLELAKKLKELGVKQESCFVYAKREGDGWKNTEFDKSPIPVEWNDERIHESIPTYTVAELGEMLKETTGNIPTNHFRQSWWLGGSENKWFGGLQTKDRDSAIYADTEADCRAKMLIYLLENNLITL